MAGPQIQDGFPQSLIPCPERSEESPCSLPRLHPLPPGRIPGLSPAIPPSPSLQSHISQSQEWSTAFNLWLESHPSSNTRRSYRKSWQLFLSFTHKKPWQISKSDIASWVSDLRSQDLSPETINLRLAALSSFYTYVTQTYTHLSPEGVEQPLYHYNPVKAVPRPKINPYGKARCLTIDQARAFLHSIPRWTLQGKRDYALFLAYLATGRRNSEIRLLCWGDFQEQESGLVFYRWRGKGNQRKDYCPPPVWSAIFDLLKSCDCLESISPSDFIFIPLNNNALHLPNVRSSNTSQSPLSSQMVCRLLNKYLHRAGIEFHPHHCSLPPAYRCSPQKRSRRRSPIYLLLPRPLQPLHHPDLPPKN